MFEVFNIYYVVIFQLAVALLISMVAAKISLAHKNRRIDRLQHAFQDLTEKVNQNNQRRKNVVRFDLDYEIQVSEERYQLGDYQISLDELKVDEYPHSLAIPFRLAYLRAEQLAARERKSRTYWVTLDKLLEQTLEQFTVESQAEKLSYSEGAVSVDQTASELDQSAVAEVIGVDDSRVNELERQLSQLQEKVKDYDEKSTELVRIRSQLSSYELALNQLQINKQKVLPEISTALVTNDQRDQIRALLESLGDYFSDIEDYFAHVAPAPSGNDDNLVAGKSTPEFDSGAARINMLNNIIEQQGKEMESLLETEQAYQDLMQQHAKVQAEFDRLTHQMRESEQVIVQLEQALDQGKSDYQALLAQVSETDTSRAVNPDMERIALDSEAAPIGHDTEFDFDAHPADDLEQSAAAGVDVSVNREANVLQQDLLMAELAHIKIEQEFFTLFADYQALKALIHR